MGDIDRIEAARGGAFEFRLDGDRIAVLPAPEWGYQEILGVLDDSRRFLPEHWMPQWKRALLAAAWAAHYDLPEFRHAQRLCYLVDRYADALISDLRAYANADLSELWHSRRWRTLLAVIDRLPATSAYAVAVSQDDEHAKMLAEALAKREEDGEGDSGPSLATWSPEVDVLTSLRDDVRGLQYYVRLTGGDKKAQPPKPLPRPVTPMQRAMRRADFEHRKAKHESLVARMLPHKAKR